MSRYLVQELNGSTVGKTDPPCGTSHPDPDQEYLITLVGARLRLGNPGPHNLHLPCGLPIKYQCSETYPAHLVDFRISFFVAIMPHCD